jgi:lysozyme
MPSIVPPKRPLQPLKDTRKIIHAHGVTDEVVLVGVRGYYRDTMGILGKNDRGLYDDAIFLVGQEAYASFNANTDPSKFKKHYASLKPGVWLYKKGKHNSPSGASYLALRQAAPVTVLRDQEGEDTGLFGINIHKGSYNGTSSLGCQTIYPAQWEAFLSLVYSEMNRSNQAVIKYVLVENN